MLLVGVLMNSNCTSPRYLGFKNPILTPSLAIFLSQGCTLTPAIFDHPSTTFKPLRHLRVPSSPGFYLFSAWIALVVWHTVSLSCSFCASHWLLRFHQCLNPALLFCSECAPECSWRASFPGVLSVLPEVEPSLAHSLFHISGWLFQPVFSLPASYITFLS